MMYRIDISLISSGGCCCLSRTLLDVVCVALITTVMLALIAAQQCEDHQYHEQTNCSRDTTPYFQTVSTEYHKTSVTNNVTTPVTSYTVAPFTTKLTSFATTTVNLIPECCRNCSEKCQRCVGLENSMCLTCNKAQALLPGNCQNLLHACDMQKCNETCRDANDICKCMLEESACSNCSRNMYGTCYDTCPDSTLRKEISNSTFCFVCDSHLFGLCVKRYIAPIIGISVGIFVLLLGVIVLCLCVCYYKGYCSRSGDKRNSKKRPDVPMRDYSPEASFTQEENGLDDFAIVQEDVYGNVDTQNNVLLNKAPVKEQRASSQHQNPLHTPAHPVIEETPGDIYQNTEIGSGLQPEVEEDDFYGNQDVVRPKGNRDNNYPRKEVLHTQLPPTLPKKTKASETFPLGSVPDFEGHMNEGFDEVYDLGTAPLPPIKDYNKSQSLGNKAPLSPPYKAKPWERPDLGSVETVNELQQRLNTRLKKSEPDSPEDLPSLPPPLPPSKETMKPLSPGGPRTGMRSFPPKIKTGLAGQSTPLNMPGPPIVSPKPTVKEPEDDELYEPVEYKSDDDSREEPIALPISSRQDPGLRPPCALPQTKKNVPPVPGKPSLRSKDVYKSRETQLDNKNRPGIPMPQEDDREVYEDVNKSSDVEQDAVYEVTDDMGKGTPILEEDDIYQNEPATGKHIKSGRYRNLPRDQVMKPKESGYTKWSGVR